MFILKQNILVRPCLLPRFGKSEHITPVLYYFHGLLMELIIECCFILIRTLLDQTPPYICEIVSKYKPRRQLRSSEKCMLVIPKNRTQRFDLFFLYASAKLWKDVCGDRLAERTLMLFFKCTESFKLL